jgi:peroxiredoxin
MWSLRNNLIPVKPTIPFTLLVAFVLVLASCKEDTGNSFVVKGKLEVMQNTDARLYQLGIEKAILVDSVQITGEGIFELKGTIEHPALFSLNIGSFEEIYLVIHPGDDVTTEIDNTIYPRGYTVEGSTDSRLVRELMQKQMQVRDQITQISIEYENSKRNPENFEENKARFDSIYNSVLEDHKQFSTAFIQSNSKSLATIFALYQNFGVRKNIPLFDSYSDIEVFNFVDSCLSAQYPQTEAVIALNRDVTELKAQVEHKKYSEQLITPGRKAPDFEVITIDGNLLTLEDYSNEPVVFVFFAVWDASSVEQLLTINSFVQQYPYRKVNVVGVSFDTSPEKLRNFIEENNVTMPIACDYKYWESGYVHQFGVQHIPDILLLNTSHIIYQRDLSAQETIQIITEWKRIKIF